MASSSDRSHENSFGALRLLLAILVIVSHSLEFGRASLYFISPEQSGRLAVLGFFMISGYLITQSFEHSTSLRSYFLKRVLRIYPAFLVASLISIYVVAPLVGGRLSDVSVLSVVRDLLLLQPPVVPGVFAGNAFANLNSPLWTISYEFKCYLLVPLLGALGLLRARRIILLLIAVGLVLLQARPGILLHTFDRAVPIFGAQLIHGVNFVTAFLIGMAFYLYRDVVRYDGRLAIVSAAALFACLPFLEVDDAGPNLFVAYPLFWAAFSVRNPRITAIGQRADLSYGTYLYAWPIQSSLAWFFPQISPWLVILITIPAALCCAVASWTYVERPAMKRKTVLAAQPAQ